MRSLALLLLLLFADGATFGLTTTPLLVAAGAHQAPWVLAVFGGLASALGSAVQLLFFRWALAEERPWLRRFLPLRAKLEEGLARYRKASFLALIVVRATPVPDMPLKLVAAAGRYPVLLYALAVWLGALPYYFVLAKLGEMLRPPWWAVATALAVVIGVAALERFRRSKAAA